jgi:hypothetical protein
MKGLIYAIVCAGAFALLVSASQSATAAWGCYARNAPSSTGMAGAGNFGQAWRREAGAQAKSQCASMAMEQHGNGPCHIVACAADINSQADECRLFKLAVRTHRYHHLIANACK